MLRKKVLVSLIVLLSSPDFAWGAAQVSITGNASTSHTKLTTEEKSALSAGIAFDVFSMMQLGYTLRTSSESEYGSQETRVPAFPYQGINDETNVVKQSVDLTFVPFVTKTFVPFIFAGLAQSTYKRRIETEMPDGSINAVSVSLKPGDGENPLFSKNGGLGVRIPLNSDFSIKLQQTWTEGVTQDPGEEAKEAVDTYTEFGISYNL